MFVKEGPGQTKAKELNVNREGLGMLGMCLLMSCNHVQAEVFHHVRPTDLLPWLAQAESIVSYIVSNATFN